MLYFKYSSNLEKIRLVMAELMNSLEEVKFDLVFKRSIKFESEEIRNVEKIV